MGRPVSSELTANPQFELTGLGVSTPEKVGRDAGALCGRAVGDARLSEVLENIGRVPTAGFTVVGSVRDCCSTRAVSCRTNASHDYIARRGNPIVDEATYDTAEVMHQMGCGRSLDETPMPLQPGVSSVPSPR